MLIEKYECEMSSDGKEIKNKPTTQKQIRMYSKPVLMIRLRLAQDLVFGLVLHIYR